MGFNSAFKGLKFEGSKKKAQISEDPSKTFIYRPMCAYIRVPTYENPDTAPLFVQCSLWCIIDAGRKSKFRITGSFSSQNSMAAKRGWRYIWVDHTQCEIYTLKHDIHGSVHHNTIVIKLTNKMQLCRTIYYSIVPLLLYIFQAILSLIIRSILTVITASGFIHMCCCRLMLWISHDSSRQDAALHV